jgi:hypothetical protein
VIVGGFLAFNASVAPTLARPHVFRPPLPNGTLAPTTDADVPGGPRCT